MRVPQRVDCRMCRWRCLRQAVVVSLERLTRIHNVSYRYAFPLDQLIKPQPFQRIRHII